MPAKTSYRKGVRRKTKPVRYLCSEQKVNKILHADDVFAGMARSYTHGPVCQIRRVGIAHPTKATSF